MDSHEKLGKLLSQYLTSQNSSEPIPEQITDAFHALGLSEFASREHVEEMYHEKCENIKSEMMTSGNSSFSREYEAQQKKVLDDAYSLIINWLDNKD